MFREQDYNITHACYIETAPKSFITTPFCSQETSYGKRFWPKQEVVSDANIIRPDRMHA